MRPSHFVSLQELGFACNNYYYGKGGEQIGLTHEELAAAGINSETIWVHPDVISPLSKAVCAVKSYGMGITIKDGWRPKKLYGEIVDHFDKKGEADKRSLINTKDMPHATGKAIDVVLTDLKNGQAIWTRNQQRDGKDCYKVDFYRQKTDPESVEYQRLQDILLLCFLGNGFVLGTKRENWHFQLPDTLKSERF